MPAHRMLEFAHASQPGIGYPDSWGPPERMAGCRLAAAAHGCRVTTNVLVPMTGP